MVQTFVYVWVWGAGDGVAVEGSNLVVMHCRVPASHDSTTLFCLSGLVKKKITTTAGFVALIHNFVCECRQVIEKNINDYID